MNTLVEPIYIYSIHEPEAVLTNDIANLLFETTMHVIRLFPYVTRNENVLRMPKYLSGKEQYNRVKDTCKTMHTCIS